MYRYEDQASHLDALDFIEVHLDVPAVVELHCAGADVIRYGSEPPANVQFYANGPAAAARQLNVFA